MTTDRGDLLDDTGGAGLSGQRRDDLPPSVPAAAPEPPTGDAVGSPEDDSDVTWLITDLRRLRLREGWRMSPRKAFLPLLLVKLFRMHVPQSYAVPREFLCVDRAGSVPAWAAALFASQEPALVSAGLQPVMTLSTRSLGPSAPDPIARVFIAADGRALTQLVAMPSVANGSAPHLVTICTSRTDDGALVGTSSVRGPFDDPPGTLGEVVRGDATAVYRRHGDRIAGLGVVACTVEGVPERLAAEHARSVAFHEGRGFYVPLSPAEVAALRAASRSDSTPADGQPVSHRAAVGPEAHDGPRESDGAAAASGGPGRSRGGWLSGRAATVGVWLFLVAVFTMVWTFVGEERDYGPPMPEASGGAAQHRRQPVAAKASEAQIAEALAPSRDRLEASKRQVARVRLMPMPFDDVRVSKVGGEPYLGPGESPPRTADDGAMVLLAQVNFAEVPTMRGYPSAGILQFFIARESARFLYGMNLDGQSPDAWMVQHSFRVRYIEDVDAGAMPGRAPSRCRGRCDTPHDPDRPRRMLFELQEEAISPSDVDFASVVGFEPYDWVMERAAAWRVNEHDLSERAFPPAAGHKLGGYPYFTQSDRRPPGTPLRLLLQLDSDDEMMWGDLGVGAFFIDPVDLARGDFSRVLYSWDCH